MIHPARQGLAIIKETKRKMDWDKRLIRDLMLCVVWYKSIQILGMKRKVFLKNCLKTKFNCNAGVLASFPTRGDASTNNGRAGINRFFSGGPGQVPV
jgi:hypothetical protein